MARRDRLDDLEDILDDDGDGEETGSPAYRKLHSRYARLTAAHARLREDAQEAIDFFKAVKGDPRFAPGTGTPAPQAGGSATANGEAGSAGRKPGESLAAYDERLKKLEATVGSFSESIANEAVRELEAREAQLRVAFPDAAKELWGAGGKVARYMEDNNVPIDIAFKVLHFSLPGDEVEDEPRGSGDGRERFVPPGGVQREEKKAVGVKDSIESAWDRVSAKLGPDIE